MAEDIRTLAQDQTTLLLYGTEACHLCDVAERLLAAVVSDSPVDWHYRKVDISESDALFERYGWVIPVVAAPDGRELRWPFDQSALEVFLLSRQP
jgi:hypothetical protein